MNEIMNLEPLKDLGLATLDDCNKAMFSCYNSIKEHFYGMALIVSYVNTSKLYLEGEYRNIYEWGNECFGYKKTMINNLKRVGDKFFYKNTLKWTGNDGEPFTFQQAFRLARLSDEQLESACNELNSASTIEEVDEVCSELTGRKRGDKKSKRNKVKLSNEKVDIVLHSIEYSIPFKELEKYIVK